MRTLKIALLIFIQQTKFSFTTSFLIVTALLSFYQISYSQVGEWRVFNTQNSTVPQNTFYCIGIDTADNLWLAHHVICMWDLKNSTCYYDYPYLGSDIVAIHGDSTGFVWLSLESPWIIKTNGDYWETQFLDNAMWAVTIDKNNALWGGGGQRALEGLHKYDGNNWTVFDTANSPLPFPYVAQLTSDTNGKIWGIAVGINGRALFSIDGFDWNIFPAFLPPVGISNMVADRKGNIWYSTTLSYGGPSGIVQFNGTQAFFHPTPDSIQGYPNKLLIDSEDNLWVSWQPYVAEYSNDVWTVYMDTVNYNFSDMAIDRYDNLWFSTWGNGVIAFNKNGLVLSTDKQDDVNLIKNFRLEQNFPNPFNPTTSLQYAIGSRQFVTLKVYDLLGREVATLVNEEQPAGEFEVEFDGTKLPTGIYFYQLKTGEYSETKKMILLK